MLVSDNKEYMKDWDFEKNTEKGLFPNAITIGSRLRVFWKCHICGGCWDTVMKERLGCPYCSGVKALSGFNDLSTTNPELAAQWCYEKNGNLKPQDVTKGSQKKVFWICDQGHIWDAFINSRSKGRGCPYCTNRRVMRGYNDLATLRPDLASEWNSEKNGDLKPCDIISGSKKYVWWKCRNGHEWRTKVSNRNRGNGCPVCANRVVVAHQNDFASLHPELLDEWDYEKNEHSPEEYTSGSMKQVWWICKRGHSWKTAIVYRCNGNNCPKCSEERQVSFPEKIVYFYLRKVFPEMQANYRDKWTYPYELDMYLEKQKIAVEYDGIYGHSKGKGVNRDLRKNKVCYDNGVTLIRIREHNCPHTNSTSIDYILDADNNLEPAIRFAVKKINEISGVSGVPITMPDIDISRDSGEIYSLIEYSEKENSLQIKAPEIAAMWLYEKNGKLMPEYVSYMSSKVVWWHGKCGHEWRSPVAYETRSGLCPYCTGKRVLKGYNDLETKNPMLAKEWDYDKNASLRPDGLTAKSGTKVWWKCENGHSWSASVVSRSRGNGCPICSNRIVQAGYNDVASFPDLLADWDCESNNKTPAETCIGSERNAFWICHICGYKWSAPVSKIYRGRGCPKCAEKKRRITASKTYVSRSGSLAEKRPDLIDEWDWDNNDLQPSELTCGSTKKVNWKCKKCGYRWTASVGSRCREIGGGCPSCADKTRTYKRRKTLLKNKSPLSETHLAIAAEWCYDKNKEWTPDIVTSGSGKKVWWHCSQCGTEWEAPICERTRGRGKCPTCR